MELERKGIEYQKSQVQEILRAFHSEFISVIDNLDARALEEELQKRKIEEETVEKERLYIKKEDHAARTRKGINAHARTKRRVRKEASVQDRDGDKIKKSISNSSKKTPSLSKKTSKRQNTKALLVSWSEENLAIDLNPDARRRNNAES